MFRPCNRAIVRLFNRDYKKNSYYIVYLMVSVDQPDDGPISGPKHVVVTYIC